jgi:TM2 domain-containing membrane protein YozV
MALIKCPECGKEVSNAAVACPSCGHPIAGPVQVYASAPIRKWSPGVAAVLSLVIPGAGQIYKGQIANGVAWLIIVPIGYVMFIIPGAILHLCCIVGASRGDPTE